MEINFASLQNQQQATSRSGVQLAANFDDFLTLLTTQLQNQDPLEPMDATEFTNQLVAFAEVEQQINSNEKLDTLVSASSSNMFPMALGYIDLEVRYFGQEFYTDGINDPPMISYALEKEAQKATLFIKDEEGQIIHTRTLSGETLKGDVTWDGKLANGTMAPAGTYTVSVEALDAQDQPIDSATVVGGRVAGVEIQGNILTVIIGERAVPIANILSAKTPNQNT